jgi:hypothetical protein
LDGSDPAVATGGASRDTRLRLVAHLRAAATPRPQLVAHLGTAVTPRLQLLAHLGSRGDD